MKQIVTRTSMPMVSGLVPAVSAEAIGSVLGADHDGMLALHYRAALIALVLADAKARQAHTVNGKPSPELVEACAGISFNWQAGGDRLRQRILARLRGEKRAARKRFQASAIASDVKAALEAEYEQCQRDLAGG